MKFTPRPDQEEAIQLALAQVGEGRSNACLVGDDMGKGKTLQGAEILARGRKAHGWTRGIIIALPDTHQQWAERVAAQSDGEIILRPMNGTKDGKANLAAFLKREPGFYIAGSHYLLAQDWTSKPLFESDGVTPKWKRDKKTDELTLKERAGDTIGPAFEPVRATEQVRTNKFTRATNPRQGRSLDVLLFDEVQAIANRKSKTRQTINSLKSNLKVAYSGTWFLNKVENMWSIARWLWQGVDPQTGLDYVESSFGAWSDRYLTREVVTSKDGEAQRTAAGSLITKVTGERNPGEFAASLPAYIRREAEKPPAAEVIYVDATPEQKRQLEELKGQLMTWVDAYVNENGAGKEPLVVDMPVVLRIRLRQATIAELSIKREVAAIEQGLMGATADDANAMTDALLAAREHVEETVSFAPDAPSSKLRALRGLIDGPWAGQPVAIYTDSKIGAKFIAERMRSAGYDARTWTGDLTRKERETLKQAFIAGEFDYLVVTIQSFGTGIDGLQARCNKVAWISAADGNPALNDQAIARFWRPGRTEANGGFQQAQIVMRGTVDELSMETLLHQAWQVRAAMNAPRAA